MRLSRTEIKRLLDQRYFQRAQTYHAQGKVRDLEVKEESENALVLEGKVKGSRVSDYKQMIAVTRHKDYLSIDGRCSCPVHHNCKHVGAVLLDWVAKTEFQPTPKQTAPVEKLSPNVSYLLDLIKEAAPKCDPEFDPETYPSNVKNRLFYWLDLRQTPIGTRFTSLACKSVSVLKSGALGAQCNDYNYQQVPHTGGAKFLRPSDREICGDLVHMKQASAPMNLCLTGQKGASVLAKIVSTRRAFWQDHRQNPRVLTEGAERDAQGEWQTTGDGQMRFVLNIEGAPNAVILPLDPPCYVDVETGQCGPLACDLATPLCEALLSGPPLRMQDIASFEKAVRTHHGNLAMPLPVAPHEIREVKHNPVPRLTLCERTFKTYDYSWYRSSHKEQAFPTAVVSFRYGKRIIDPNDPNDTIENLSQDVLTLTPRNRRQEQEFLLDAEDYDLSPVADLPDIMPDHNDHSGVFLLDESMEDWLSFLTHTCPDLQDEGWEIFIEESFPYQLHKPAGNWSFDFVESDNKWFDLSLGVEINGRNLDLLPGLLNLFEGLPPDTNEEDLEYLLFEDEDNLIVPIGEKDFVSMPLERLRPLIKILFQLFNVKGNKVFRFGQFDLGDIAVLEDAALESEAIIAGAQSLREAAHKLSAGVHLHPVPLPKGLNAELRPYQQEGLNWLCFLGEIGVGGVLADDMGLGKTLQTLTYLLVEKENGKLNKPCLLVVPTSLVPNWQIECTRFTPGLEMLTLHGPERKQDFDKIAQHDVVMTTYALAHRDREILLAHDYHICIFDEAQALKNPTSNLSKFASALTAKQKICLSGTPVENHLEELWSLFHCVNPGLLSDRKTFRKNFRTPIEKVGDSERQEVLNRRVRPFILRRTKNAVAAELPQKTEIIEHIELEGKQRDLYEAVRLSMDARVRETLKDKGMARSHIMVLDALLKLRQTCCDPRLVKLDMAKDITVSAKLSRLSEMLPELIEDGRRILLFSQFTSMLALIEEAVKALDIPYVQLTGQTKDRKTPVKAFQEGKVPLFLISLKAGGTGLNLTAADTVIHFDPWWNPAVERQATDRAHRIGQEKPVLVYKLITRHTVEERIQALQSRKSQLADALLDDKDSPVAGLNEQDIHWLFSPL